MNTIEHVIEQWVEVRDTNRGVRGYLTINAPTLLQSGMIIENSFYHRGHEAKIAAVRYDTENRIFYVEMEPITEPFGEEKSVKNLFNLHGWEVLGSSF